MSGRHHFPTTRDLQPLQLLIRAVWPIPKSVVYTSTGGGNRIRKPTVKVPQDERRITLNPRFGLHRKSEENTNKINSPKFDEAQIYKRRVSSKWVAFLLDYSFVVDCYGVEGHQSQGIGPGLAWNDSGFFA